MVFSGLLLWHLARAIKENWTRLIFRRRRSTHIINPLWSCITTDASVYGHDFYYVGRTCYEVRLAGVGILPKCECLVCTVYPKKYAHGFVVLCFVVVMQSFIMNSHEVFIHIHQGCFAGTGAIVRLPQCQWSKPDGYGKISQCITTTKHSKAKTVCIFLGIYCITVKLSVRKYEITSKQILLCVTTVRGWNKRTTP